MPHATERRASERRAVQRPAFENPFNFEEIEARLQASIGKRINEEGLKLGVREPKTGNEEFSFKLKQPKHVSRWGGIAKNVSNPKNLFTNDSYLIHPFRLADAMLSIKKAGRIRFWKDKRNYKKALALNEKYAPEAGKINAQFRAEAVAALAGLRNAVREGRVNRENRNSYFEKYEKAVREAEIRFQQGVKSLMSDYMKEWKGK